MGGRVVDCARLESVYTERYRGFESPPIRQCKYFPSLLLPIFLFVFPVSRLEETNTSTSRKRPILNIGKVLRKDADT